MMLLSSISLIWDWPRVMLAFMLCTPQRVLGLKKVGDAPDPQTAAEMLGLGADEEVIAYLGDLMGNPMYRE